MPIIRCSISINNNICCYSIVLIVMVISIIYILWPLFGSSFEASQCARQDVTQSVTFRHTIIPAAASLIPSVYMIIASQLAIAGDWCHLIAGLCVPMLTFFPRLATRYWRHRSVATLIIMSHSDINVVITSQLLITPTIPFGWNSLNYI